MSNEACDMVRDYLFRQGAAGRGAMISYNHKPWYYPNRLLVQSRLRLQYSI